MKCLNPPLLAKPAKGYSWVCLPCLVQRRKDVEEQKFHYVPNGSAPAKPKNGKAKEKVVDPGRPDRTYRGWPWRYFGYVRVMTTLTAGCIPEQRTRWTRMIRSSPVQRLGSDSSSRQMFSRGRSSRRLKHGVGLAKMRRVHRDI